MTYDIDNIPAKIYFKIIETGNLSLLSNESLPNNQLQTIWNKIESDYNAVFPNKEINRVIDVSKNIESLEAKYRSIKHAVYCLKLSKDDELIELLNKHGFALSNNYMENLTRVEKESDTILLQISKLKQDLPEPFDEESNEKTSFEYVVLSYCVLTGLSYKPSSILLLEYNPLIKLGNQKMKYLRKNGRERKSNI